MKSFSTTLPPKPFLARTRSTSSPSIRAARHDPSAILWIMACLLLRPAILPAQQDPILLGKWPAHALGASYETPTLTPMDVQVVGSHAYVACGENGLRVLDVTDAATPHEVGHFQTDGYASRVMVSGETAFITQVYYGENVGEKGGITLIDIASPSNPSLHGVYRTTGNVQDLASSGQFAFVAVSEHGPAGGRMEVIDMSDVANPRLVGRFSAESFYCYAVAVSGNHAYMTTEQRFYVLDVADTLDPQSLGWCEIEHGGHGVTISGNHAYVANHLGGLLVIEIGDPSNPRSVGHVSMRGLTSGVSGAGRFAYATAYTGAPEGWGYLRVFDVNDPVNPQWHASYNTGWMASPSGVSIVADLIYVAAQSGGLQILDRNALINQPRTVSLGPPVRDPYGRLRLPLIGPTELRVRIQRSVNLREWEDWHTVSLGGHELIDDDFIGYSDQPGAWQRFYRAVGDNSDL